VIPLVVEKSVVARAPVPNTSSVFAVTFIIYTALMIMKQVPFPKNPLVHTFSSLSILIQMINPGSPEISIVPRHQSFFVPKPLMTFLQFRDQTSCRKMQTVNLAN